eukprot:TRINITY_DN23189_c0_g1_i1.p1 TRINITY_DN23189_c0_g1~~TRINITY_DN23189_c0_g1_i1.p1  ORF type:complete len:134 (-),score=29.52 TRINITY_DN23189_c0_g1_i1:165-566(-)
MRSLVDGNCLLHGAVDSSTKEGVRRIVEREEMAKKKVAVARKTLLGAPFVSDYYNNAELVNSKALADVEMALKGVEDSRRRVEAAFEADSYSLPQLAEGGTVPLTGLVQERSAAWKKRRTLLLSGSDPLLPPT